MGSINYTDFCTYSHKKGNSLDPYKMQETPLFSQLITDLQELAGPRGSRHAFLLLTRIASIKSACLQGPAGGPGRLHKVTHHWLLPKRTEGYTQKHRQGASLPRSAARSRVPVDANSPAKGGGPGARLTTAQGMAHTTQWPQLHLVLDTGAPIR